MIRGRDALRRQAWGDAHAAFAAAETRDRLEPADVEGAALAAYLTGRDEASEVLWARAYRAWLDGGAPDRAARCAFWLGLPLLLKGESARGGGWLARGARLLDERADDCAERGLLLVPDGLRALAAGDASTAITTCGRIVQIGARFHDANVLAFGRLGGGQALIASGQVAEGVALLDEAMVAVTADDVSPITTGLVYCAVLLACQETFDLPRANEWTAALSRWCDAQQDIVPFRGDCLVHRSEILQMRGQWQEALVEARRACDWLAGRPAAGRAHYQVGELHRLRGELAEADRAYQAASAAGRQPQPGCALLRLAQGHLDAATAMVARAVEQAPSGGARARILPGYIEIALARRDVSAARRGADDLRCIADRHDASLLHAIAAHASGTVLLAEGDARAACAALQEACARWQELSAPYDAARAGVAIALACQALGDRATAEMELEAARATFAHLGARPELERVERLAGMATGAAGADLTAREIEVLALVAAGRTNPQIAEALVLSPHTVRRHLQNIFRKAGVSSRAAATAFALRHGLVENGMARVDQ